jgi:hypothetical protein
MNRNESVEHRKYRRFRIPRDAFAALGPHFNQVGPLTDISKGWLAFCYASRKKQPSGLSLDIFLTDDDFCLSCIPLKEVVDSEAPNDADGYARKRRCRVQFGDLTENQLSRIEHIILKHTAKEW